MENKRSRVNSDQTAQPKFITHFIRHKRGVSNYLQMKKMRETEREREMLDILEQGMYRKAKERQSEGEKAAVK